MERTSIIKAAAARKQALCGAVSLTNQKVQMGSCGLRLTGWGEQLLRRYGVSDDGGLEPVELVFLSPHPAEAAAKAGGEKTFAIICRLILARYNRNVRVLNRWRRNSFFLNGLDRRILDRWILGGREEEQAGAGRMREAAGCLEEVWTPALSVSRELRFFLAGKGAACAPLRSAAEESADGDIGVRSGKASFGLVMTGTAERGAAGGYGRLARFSTAIFGNSCKILTRTGAYEGSWSEKREALECARPELVERMRLWPAEREVLRLEERGGLWLVAGEREGLWPGERRGLRSTEQIVLRAVEQTALRSMKQGGRRLTARDALTGKSTGTKAAQLVLPEGNLSAAPLNSGRSETAMATFPGKTELKATIGYPSWKREARGRADGMQIALPGQEKQYAFGKLFAWQTAFTGLSESTAGQSFRENLRWKKILRLSMAPGLLVSLQQGNSVTGPTGITGLPVKHELGSENQYYTAESEGVKASEARFCSSIYGGSYAGNDFETGKREAAGIFGDMVLCRIQGETKWSARAKGTLAALFEASNASAVKLRPGFGRTAAPMYAQTASKWWLPPIQERVRGERQSGIYLEPLFGSIVSDRQFRHIFCWPGQLDLAAGLWPRHHRAHERLKFSGLAADLGQGGSVDRQFVRPETGLATGLRQYGMMPVSSQDGMMPVSPQDGAAAGLPRYDTIARWLEDRAFAVRPLAGATWFLPQNREKAVQPSSGESPFLPKNRTITGPPASGAAAGVSRNGKPAALPPFVSSDAMPKAILPREITVTGVVTGKLSLVRRLALSFKPLCLSDSSGLRQQWLHRCGESRLRSIATAQKNLWNGLRQFGKGEVPDSNVFCPVVGTELQFYGCPSQRRKAAHTEPPRLTATFVPRCVRAGICTEPSRLTADFVQLCTRLEPCAELSQLSASAGAPEGQIKGYTEPAVLSMRAAAGNTGVAGPCPSGTALYSLPSAIRPPESVRFLSFPSGLPAALPGTEAFHSRFGAVGALRGELILRFRYAFGLPSQACISSVRQFGFSLPLRPDGGQPLGEGLTARFQSGVCALLKSDIGSAAQPEINPSWRGASSLTMWTGGGRFTQPGVNTVSLPGVSLLPRYGSALPSQADIAQSPRTGSALFTRQSSARLTYTSQTLPFRSSRALSICLGQAMFFRLRQALTLRPSQALPLRSNHALFLYLSQAQPPSPSQALSLYPNQTQLPSASQAQPLYPNQAFPSHQAPLSPSSQAFRVGPRLPAPMIPLPAAPEPAIHQVSPSPPFCSLKALQVIFRCAAAPRPAGRTSVLGVSPPCVPIIARLPRISGSACLPEAVKSFMTRSTRTITTPSGPEHPHPSPEERGPAFPERLLTAQSQLTANAPVDFVFPRQSAAKAEMARGASVVRTVACDPGDPFARYNAYNETHGQSGDEPDLMEYRARQFERESREVNILNEKLLRQETMVQELEKGQKSLKEQVERIAGGKKPADEVIRRLRREISMEKKRFGIQ